VALCCTGALRNVFRVNVGAAYESLLNSQLPGRAALPGTRVANENAVINYFLLSRTTTYVPRAIFASPPSLVTRSESDRGRRIKRCTRWPARLIGNVRNPTSDRFWPMPSVISGEKSIVRTARGRVRTSTARRFTTGRLSDEI